MSAAAIAVLAFGFTWDRRALDSREPTTVSTASWLERWDGEVGLWRQDHPGHTGPVRELRRIHPAPSAASRLLLAAQARQLNQVDVTAVLRAIRRMQMLAVGTKGHGELRWYWEEKKPVDHNGSFFTGISMIALYRGHADALTSEQRAALLEIFRDLHVWFVGQALERDFYYPNRHLGDVVCAWLLGEITGSPDTDGQLRQAMLDAADYWAKEHWGWGEHLSDIYAGICLDELSALLLFSEKLPADVREKYTALFHNLLALDDAFGHLPRVPAIRTYAFTESPTRLRYRDTIVPLGSEPLRPPATPVMPPESGGVFHHRSPLGATLHNFGWHDLAPPADATPQPLLEIPCFGDATATAYLQPDVRIGSLSRYPIMPAADRPKWGNSWQSTPVALLRPAGDWGFLQWESREGDRVRAHPAIDLMTGYMDNALCADDAVHAVGRTFALQRGGDVLVIRHMPVVPASWDRLVDRVRFVGARVSPAASSVADGAHRLTLTYPERTIGLQCVPLSPSARVKLNVGDRGGDFDWEVVLDKGALAKSDTVTTVWGISVNGAIKSLPRIERVGDVSGQAFDLHWVWPKTTWRVRVDLRSDEVIRELASDAPIAVIEAIKRLHVDYPD